MIKAVVFDFDGVLVDSEPLHYRAFVQIAEPLGVQLDYPTYTRALMGFDDRDVSRLLLEQAGRGPEPDVIEAMCRDKQRAFDALVARGVPVVTSVRGFLDRLGPTPAAIASGATRRDIEVVLGQLGLYERFEVIVTADDVPRSKPDPQTYAQAVAQLAERHTQLGLRPGDCLAIEDTPTGVASARAAGLWTVALTTTTPRDELTSAHRVVESMDGVTLDDLQSWFA